MLILELELELVFHIVSLGLSLVKELQLCIGVCLTEDIVSGAHRKQIAIMIELKILYYYLNNWATGCPTL